MAEPDLAFCLSPSLPLSPWGRLVLVSGIRKISSHALLLHPGWAAQPAPSPRLRWKVRASKNTLPTPSPAEKTKHIDTYTQEEKKKKPKKRQMGKKS